MKRLRAVTYNIHKGRGMDRRVQPERIARVLREIGADIVALQEVVNVPGEAPDMMQAQYLAAQLGLQCVMGPTRQYRGGPYGNALLTRLPVRASRTHNLSVTGREPRGCLRVDLELPGGRTLHVINIHLGTSFFERRHQIRTLMTPAILMAEDFSGPRIVLGDFNEWTRGLATRLLSAHLHSADPRLHAARRRTYPGFIPVLHLDHIYYDPTLQLERVASDRSPLALVASDHVPLYADFALPGPL